MESYMKTIPERVITMRPGSLRMTKQQFNEMRARYKEKGEWGGGNRYEYKIIVPEHEVRCVPTLATLHSWFHGDWGPLYLTWKDGLLCPFHSDIGRRNMTCCNGLRKRCGGLPIRDRHVSHLSTDRQRNLVGRVVCYRWCYVLGRVYWDTSVDEFIEFDNDLGKAAVGILHMLYHRSGFFDWYFEQRRRNNKSRREWLGTMEGIPVDLPDRFERL